MQRHRTSSTHFVLSQRLRNVDVILSRQHWQLAFSRSFQNIMRRLQNRACLVFLRRATRQFPDAPNAQWTFDSRNGAPLRAPLEMYVPKSQWNFSSYTGLVWTPSPRLSTPITNQYALLQQVSQFPSQYASRLATQQSTPILNKYQPLQQLNNSHHNTRRALIHSSQSLPDPPLRRRLPASHTRRRLVAISPHLSTLYTTNPTPLTRRPWSIPTTVVLYASLRVAFPTVIEKDALARRLVAN